MNSSSDQNASLTHEQFETAMNEAEALHRRGEHAKAASILIQLMERAENDHLRELIAMVFFGDLSDHFPPELAVRFARAANGNEQIFNELLEKTAGMPAETISEIVALRNEARKVSSKEGKALREAEALYERGESIPEAEATLIQIIETTRSDEMRKHAVWALCRRPVRPELTLRVARVSTETDIFFALLSESAALPPDTVRELMTWIVMNGHLDTNSEYFKVAERGGIPDDFVPSVFAGAGENMRHPLLIMASRQLRVRADERLHRFMVNVIYGDYSRKTRDDAGLFLGIAYRENNALARDRFRIDQAFIQRFFGSVPEFIPRLMALLRDSKSLGEHSQLRQHVSYACSEANPSVAAEFFAEEAATHKLVLALLEAVGENNYPQELRDAMLKFLGFIGTHPRWSREVGTELFRIASRKNDEARLDAAVTVLKAVPDHINLTEADPKNEGTIGDRLADRVEKMADTSPAASPAVMLKLARQLHKIEINDHARQRILGQLMAVSLVHRDDEALTAVMKLIPTAVTNPILAFNLACTAARQKDRAAMLKYTKLTLTLSKLSAEFRADTDFAPYLQDREFAALLDATQ